MAFISKATPAQRAKARELYAEGLLAEDVGRQLDAANGSYRREVA
jgi:hypothetical protein